LPERRQTSGQKTKMGVVVIGIAQDLIRTEHPLLPQLGDQIDRFVAANHAVNRMRGPMIRQNIERELELVSFQLRHFVSSREFRVAELNTPPMVRARAIKAGLFPMGLPIKKICGDGRFGSKTQDGVDAEAIRLPGGDTQAFVRNRNGGFFIPPNTTIARMIINRVMNHPTEVISIVLDSHVGCAYRVGEAKSHDLTNNWEDDGLRRDVRRKSDMGQAILRLIRSKFGNTKSAVIIQTSFDPTTGFYYMGLEHCINDPIVIRDGFTSEVLRRLTEEGRIISVEDICKDPKVRGVLERHRFDINYEHNYAHSTLRFWKAIVEMCHELLPVIEERVRRIFNQDHSANEVGQRAMLLLGNLFSGFLLGGNPQHQEAIIVLTLQQADPYPVVKSFSVDPDHSDLNTAIDLGRTLIQKNRAAGQMTPLELNFARQLYPTPKEKEFVSAPVLMVYFEQLEHVSQDIDGIQAVDWSSLADTSWLEMSEEEWNKFMAARAPDQRMVTAIAMRALRRRSKEMLESSIRDRILAGTLIPVPILAGPQRETLAIYPFLTPGYDDTRF
jgi:hypothetical protein